jgi:hypothetical protein
MLESTASVFTTLGDYSVLNPDGITDGTVFSNPDMSLNEGIFVRP